MDIKTKFSIGDKAVLVQTINSGTALQTYAPGIVTKITVNVTKVDGKPHISTIYTLSGFDGNYSENNLCKDEEEAAAVVKDWLTKKFNPQ